MNEKTQKRKEYLRNYAKQWRLDNKEKVKEYGKQYWQREKEKIMKVRKGFTDPLISENSKIQSLCLFSCFECPYSDCVK